MGSVRVRDRQRTPRIGRISIPCSGEGKASATPIPLPPFLCPSSPANSSPQRLACPQAIAPASVRQANAHEPGNGYSGSGLIEPGQGKRGQGIHREMNRGPASQLSATMGMTDAICRMKVLVAADIHQRQGKLQALEAAVSRERPDVVVLNGDLLDVGATYQHQLSLRACAANLSGLPPCELIVVRGNHEDANWIEFLDAWPVASRRLILLHGSAVQHGPLTLLGFPPPGHRLRQRRAGRQRRARVRRGRDDVSPASTLPPNADGRAGASLG